MAEKCEIVEISGSKKKPKLRLNAKTQKKKKKKNTISPGTKNTNKCKKTQLAFSGMPCMNKKCIKMYNFLFSGNAVQNCKFLFNLRICTGTGEITS